MDRSRFGYLEVVNADTASPGTNDDKMNLAFDRVEASANERQLDMHPPGVISGMSVVENSTPNMTVRVLAGVAQDQTGQRIEVPGTQSVDMETDYQGNAIALPSGGNEKYASVFVRFKRLNQESRQDGNSVTYYQSELESFEIRVRAGSEAATGTATPPALQGAEILLADVLLTPGMTAIGTGDIELLDRRQDAWKLSPTNALPKQIRVGTAKAAVTQLLDWMNDLLDGTLTLDTNGVTHTNGAETFAGAVAPPTSGSLRTWLRALVTDLGASTGTTGGQRIGNASLGQWADGTDAGLAGALGTQVIGIITALAAATGTAKVGGAAVSQSPTSLTAKKLSDQIIDLMTAINARARKASAETITAKYTFDLAAPGTGLETAADTSTDLAGPVNVTNKLTVDLAAPGVGIETVADTTTDFNGPVNLDGAVTQTAAVTKSGADATTAWRITASTDADGTYDITSDEYRVPNTLAAGRTYTLRSSTSPIPVAGHRIRFSRTGSLLTNTVTFQREGATTIASFSAGTPAWVEFTFYDSEWRVTGWGGNTTVAAVV